MPKTPYEIYEIDRTEDLFDLSICQLDDFISMLEGNGSEGYYTQVELDEIIGEYANTKLYQSGYQAGVKAENEACAKIAYSYFDGIDCAEDIRARIK